MFEIAGLAGFIILSLLGVYVIYKNNGDYGQSLNIIVSLWLLSTSVWSLGQFLMIVARNSEELLIPIQISFISIFLMSSTTLHAALNYPSKSKIMNFKWMPFLLYVPFAFFSFILFTNNVHFLFLKTVAYNPNTILHHSITYGFVGNIGKIVPYLFIFISFGLFLYSGIRNKGRVRTGSLLLSTGLFFGILSSVLSEFQIMPATTLFPLSGLFFAIAIIKYQMVFITPATAANNILRTMNDGLIITDVNNNIIKINNAITSMLGFSDKDLFNKNIKDLFRNDNDSPLFSKMLQNVYNGKLINSYTEELSKKNNGRICGSINISSIRENDAVVGYVYNIRDVTKEKRSKQRLKESKQALESTNKALQKRTEEVESLLNQKDELIHLMAHDLKNPLSTPMSVLPLVEKKITDEKLKRMLRVSIKNIHTMHRIINETLKLSKYEDFSDVTKQKKIHVSELIKKVLDANQSLIENNQFNVEMTDSDDLVFCADEFQMEELLNNLISNAIKYTPKNVSGMIKIGAKKDDENVVISVSDNGQGLSEQEKIKVFEKFYKSGSPRKGMDSTGLGLGICKNIVTRHDGEIWAESEGKGKGSTFYISIPLNDESKKIDIKNFNMVEQKVDELISIK
ncbi:MAG: PAS domain S-box protein [Candidatus Thermoplasmatota archaeon]|nr:PAS domain S-box protein [Candidatus Thermoplasmatota archaeon]